MTPSPSKAKPGRPRKLTREQINAAALKLLVEEGFSSLSLRALAQRLKASPASLYNYIGRIEDVERDVLEGLMAQLPIPSRQRPEPLRLQLIEHLIAVRWQQMLHPHFLHAPLGSATWHLHMRVTRQVVETLAETDAQLVESVVAYNTLVSMVGASAERARITGNRAYFEAERDALLTLDGEEIALVERTLRARSPDVELGSLVSRLNYLITRLLPTLETVSRESLNQLESRLQPLITGAGMPTATTTDTLRENPGEA